MKKLIVVFLAFSMILGSAFAAEPVANFSIAEFTGEAKVTWGVDLDSGLTGFKNATKVSLKLNLFDGGEKSTTGEGVWAELKIKTDSDTFVKWENETNEKNNPNKGMSEDGWLGLKLVLDVAKLHFGDFYVGIKSGDTQVGEFKLQQAISSGDRSKLIANVGAGSTEYIWSDFDLTIKPPKYTEGIVAGYKNDLFGVDIDFRSLRTTNTTDSPVPPMPVYEYTNQYALAAEATVTPIGGLEVKAGGSYNFPTQVKTVDASFPSGFNQTVSALGIGANVAYKFAIDDTFYVKPQVGYTFENYSQAADINNQAAVDAKETLTASQMRLNAGLLFAWGEETDANADVYFFDGDGAKKVTPGVSIQASLPLTLSMGMKNNDGEATITTSGRSIGMSIALFSGEIVENLTAAAYFDLPKGFGGTETTVLAVTNVENETVETKYDMTYAFGLGAKYRLALDPAALTIKAGFFLADKNYTLATFGDKGKTTPFEGVKNAKLADDGVFNLKLGVDVGGLINNTTFSVDYASANLMNTTDNVKLNKPDIKLGQVSVSAKIAF